MSEKPDQIEDPQQLINGLRIESIMGIRNSIHEKRLIVKEARNQDKLLAVSGYRSLIESYVLEVASLFSVYESGTQLLHSKDYGKVGFSPEDIIIESSSHGMVSRHRLLVDHESYKDSEKFWYSFYPEEMKDNYVDIEGLYSVIKLDDPIEFALDLRKYNGKMYGGGGTSVTEKVTLQIPLKTLDEMLIDMNLFLASIGFELEPMVELESPEI
jgi:hypothetical protein